MQPKLVFFLIAVFIASAALSSYAAASGEYEESGDNSCTKKPIESPCGCFMGPPGPAGTPGGAGTPGSVGPPGVPGIQGPQGLTGSIGPKGEPGLEGGAGTDGTDGDKGEAGEKGEPGQDGVNGSRGVKGTKGAKGAKGDTGLNGDSGEKGDQGDAGPAGRDGDPGTKGSKGVVGNTGAKGESGLKGDSGEKGDQGDAGPAGRSGDPGTKGSKGAVGNSGTKGEPGNPCVPPPLSMFTAIRTTTLYVSSGSQTVVFDTVKVNLGNDYSETSGVFTCRTPGAYYFAFSVLPSTNYKAYVQIMQNEDVIVKAYFASGSQYGTISQSAVLDLEEGDEVYVQGVAETYLYGSSNGYTSFTGHLLYPAVDMPEDKSAQ